MSLALNTTMQDAACRVQVVGEVDVSNAPELRQELDEALATGAGRIEVDVAQLSYIDSTGIGVLVGAAHRAQEADCQLVVTHPQRNVARVLGLLGVGEQLGIDAK